MPTITKEQITFVFAFVGFVLSLYNFWRDSRKIKMSYKFIKDKNNNYQFLGIVSNPSKSPNSVISYSFFDGSKELRVAKADGKGFNADHFYQPSKVQPLKIGDPLPVGSSLLFGALLLEKNITRRYIKLKFKTANYRKTFWIKIKDDF